MGCSIPVVASAVGANIDIVSNGHNGFLANTSDDWFKALEMLLMSELARSSMGAYGRRMVEEKYSLQINAPKLLSLFLSIKP